MTGKICPSPYDFNIRSILIFNNDKKRDFSFGRFCGILEKYGKLIVKTTWRALYETNKKNIIYDSDIIN